MYVKSWNDNENGFLSSAIYKIEFPFEIEYVWVKMI